jgi:hypothetical protein
MEIYDELVRLLEIGAPTDIKTYLDKEYLTFRNQNPGKEIDFLWYIEESIKTIWGSMNGQNRKKFVYEWMEEKRKELKAEVKETGAQVKKIKWNGSPSVFGYLFLELVKKGFIDPPPYNGEPNFAELSRLCFQYFDIDTTPENLKKVLNENSNQLSETKRAKFTIPHLSDLD